MYGWVRAFRSNRFIALNDGSTINNLQIVVDFENFDENLIKNINTASSLKIVGEVVESQEQDKRLKLLLRKLLYLEITLLKNCRILYFSQRSIA